jgi:hypothetical protein
VACHSASDPISIFDASLLWFDQDPDEQLHGYGYYGWIVLLTRDHEVHDLALALLSEVAKGWIRAKTTSWLPHYTPKDWKDRLNSPDGLDPRGTNITISDLVKFARERDQKPSFLVPFMTELTVDTAEASQPTSADSPKHGPEPGTLRRYDAADKALFSELERLMGEGRSRTAAALILAEAGKIAGPSTTTLESKARRLAKLHKVHKSKSGESGN